MSRFPCGRESSHAAYHEPHPASLHVHPRHTEPEYDCRMDAAAHDQLWVITAISNPVRFKSRFALYRKFRHHITKELKLHLITVECAFGDREHHITDDQLDTVVIAGEEDGVRTIDVRVRNHSQVWLKESLQNIGARFLPDSCRYVLFADADIEFCNKHIATEIVNALQVFKVVQPFETAADLGPQGQIIGVHRSFGWCHANGWPWRPRLDTCGYYSAKKPQGVGCEGFGVPFHPGWGLALRRDVLDKLQMLEVGLLGAGDHHMCGALIGKAHLTFPKGIHENYKKAVLAWQDRAKEVVNGSFGWVDGTILHGFHGAKANRRYVSRWDILIRHQYDPETDVFKNALGVTELRDNKPALRDAIRAYFCQRDEDGTPAG